MDSTILNNRIQMLPAALQKQVADFVEFLLMKYQSSAEANELSQEQKRVLNELWAEYESSPDDVIAIKL